MNCSQRLLSISTCAATAWFSGAAIGIFIRNAIASTMVAPPVLEDGVLFTSALALICACRAAVAATAMLGDKA